MIKWLSHNLRWKILSLLIAVFLWIYSNNELSYQTAPSHDFRIKAWNPQDEMKFQHETRR